MDCKTDAALWLSIVDLVAVAGGGAYLINTFNTFKTTTDKNIKTVTEKIDKIGTTIKSYIIPKIDKIDSQSQNQQIEIEQLKNQVYELNHKLDILSKQTIVIITSLQKINANNNDIIDCHIQPQPQPQYNYQPRSCEYTGLPKIPKYSECVEIDISSDEDVMKALDALDGN